MRNLLTLVAALLLSAAAMVGGASPALTDVVRGGPSDGSAGANIRFWIDVRPI